MADPRLTSSIPTSSADQTVFPYDFGGNTFDMSGFSSSPSTSAGEVRQILGEVQVAQHPYIKKEKTATLLFFLGIAAVVITLISLFFTIGLNNPRVMYISAGIAAIPLLLSICVYMKYTENNNREAREVVQNILDFHNKTFASRGLTWRIPSQFPQWIELGRTVRLHGDHDDEAYRPPNLHMGSKCVGSKGEFETSLATSAESTI